MRAVIIFGSLALVLALQMFSTSMPRQRMVIGPFGQVMTEAEWEEFVRAYMADRRVWKDV